MTDTSKGCFVILPFGQKAVADMTVDFDQIYDENLEPPHDAPWSFFALAELDEAVELLKENER